MFGLALLTSFSVSAKENYSYETYNQSINEATRNELEIERLQLQCADGLIRGFNRVGTTLHKVKLELLAETICKSWQITHHTLSFYQDIGHTNPLVGEPLLLALRNVNSDILASVSRGLHYTLFPSQFSRERLRLINLNIGTKPVSLYPSQQNVLAVNIDDWIANQERDSKGELTAWMNKILERKDVLVIVVATAKYDAAHYAAEGHEEVAAFLKDFQLVDFESSPPCAKFL